MWTCVFLAILVGGIDTIKLILNSNQTQNINSTNQPLSTNKSQEIEEGWVKYKVWKERLWSGPLCQDNKALKLSLYISTYCGKLVMGKPNGVENLSKHPSVKAFDLWKTLWKTCGWIVEKFSFNCFIWFNLIPPDIPPFENKFQPVSYTPGLDDASHCCKNRNIYLILSLLPRHHRSPLSILPRILRYAIAVQWKCCQKLYRGHPYLQRFAYPEGFGKRMDW